jgi:hypothetical protein
VSRRAPKKLRSRIPQRVRKERSLHDLADPSRRLCNSSSIPSLQLRPFVWRGAENDAKHWNVWSTRSLLLQPEAWQTTGHGSTAVRLHRHPSIDALQTGVSIERHFSRIFPAHPRSLARCLSRAQRTASFCFFRTPPPTWCVGSPLRKMQLLPWERGTLASLRARVSRG